MIVRWILLTTILVGTTESTYKRVCYYTNWAQYRQPPYQFKPGNIDFTLCTNIIYAFAEISGDAIKPYEWNDESTKWSTGNYEKMADLKKKYPDIKISLAIGGWNYGVGSFSHLVNNKTDVEVFAADVIFFLRRINFDGLDLDWEYPGNRGSPSRDKHKFTKYCQTLRKAFEKESKLTGRPRLLLTAAVAAGEKTIQTAYDIDLISKELDFINLMSYDLHGSWESQLGHNSPLYARSDESAEQKKLTQDYAIKMWLNGGAPKEKLVVGMGLYGRSFKMASSDHHLGAPASGAGKAGIYTKEAGFLSFYEICHNLANGWKRIWNDEQKIPYAYNGDQWVGYDDLESLELKVNHVKANGLGGYMVWAMDLDDTNGGCGLGKNPLQSKLKEVLLNDSIAKHTTIQSHGFKSIQSSDSVHTQHSSPDAKTAQTSQPSSSAKKTQSPLSADTIQMSSSVHSSPPHHSILPTENKPSHKAPKCGAPLTCENEKFYRDECHDNIYYQCVGSTSTLFQCPEGLVWDIKTDSCNWKYLVHNSPTHSKPIKTTSTVEVKKRSCAPTNCENGQYYADNCYDKVYYHCWDGVPHQKKCPHGTKWKQSVTSCDWASKKG